MTGVTRNAMPLRHDGEVFVAGQPMAFWLLAKHDGFARLANALLQAPRSVQAKAVIRSASALSN